MTETIKEQLKVIANIPNEIIDFVYFPLNESYPGDVEDFNALLVILGMIGCLSMWDDGIDKLIERGKFPHEDEKINDIKRVVLVRLLETLLEKKNQISGADLGEIEQFMSKIHENLRENT
jgi:hypothetical protein